MKPAPVTAMQRRWITKTGLGFLAAVSGLFAVAGLSAPGVAQEPPILREQHNIALFAGLDKITGELHDFYVYIDETVQFGALQLTPRVCYDRPPSEPEKTTVFLEVDELTLDRRIRRIFTGWMIAESPGLNAIDHPVYDVWLTGCSDTVPATPAAGQE